MANKLLKSLGLTGKKVSSQPSPSREYPTTSGSIQELHSRAPTKARSSTNVVPRGSSASASSSSGHSRPDRDARRHSDASTVRGSLPNSRGVGRGRAGGSPTVGWSLSRNNTDKDHRSPAGHHDSATIASSSVRSRRTPRSDSVTHDDIAKKSYNHADNSCPVRLQVTSVSSDNLTPRILEYSDPFDVKKEIEEVVKADEAVTSSSQFASNKEDSPQAPEDDYSVPYELKTAAGEAEAETPEETKTEGETPVVPTPKYDDPYDEAPTRLRSLSAVEDTRSDTEVQASMLSSSYADSTTSDGKTSLESSSRNVSESSGGTTSEMNGDGVLAMAEIVDPSIIGPAEEDPSGTYDEPWDLRAARLGLENRLRAAQTSNQAAHALQQKAQSFELRYKTMDPRPAMEYDEPWDRRARDVQRSLISAKSAKEEARVRREGHGTSSYLPRFVSSTCRKPDAVRHTDRSATKHAGDSMCIHSSSMMRHKCGGSFDGGVVAPPWQTIAERIDPRLPLDQQGWYHGSISRLDAESLLRVHREGSYLVRMSESNRCDFSLSLKSPRGFMHMKIVNCDDGGACGGSHYILGQFSQPFDSIPQMIHHYTINKLPIKGAEHMSLLHPIYHELL